MLQISSHNTLFGGLGFSANYLFLNAKLKDLDWFYNVVLWYNKNTFIKLLSYVFI